MSQIYQRWSDNVNVIKRILMSKTFRLMTLAVLALTSLNEVLTEVSEMDSFSLSSIGAHHGLLAFSAATFMKESWEMLEIEEEMQSEHKIGNSEDSEPQV